MAVPAAGSARSLMTHSAISKTNDLDTLFRLGDHVRQQIVPLQVDLAAR